MDPNDEIVFELTHFIRIYKSGRIERLSGNDVVPASLDSATGVTSKDVDIDPATRVTARLYLPNSPTKKKIPILLYFHGGGFIVETASSPTYHNYLNTLTSQSNMLVVSVNYRRAPEDPLPAAYNDAWRALSWVVSHADTWLAEYGDFKHVFLAGDSSGANLGHHVALRAGVMIEGLVLVHPYFLGVEPVGLEPRDKEWRERGEIFWRFVYPGTSGLDDPHLNPLADGGAGLAGMGCRRVMVCVAELDPLRERGKAYYEGLVGSGWRGEAVFVETEGEGHVFHLSEPSSDKAIALLKRVVAFLKGSLGDFDLHSRI